MNFLPGGGEWIVLLLVVLLLFGATRLPKLARSIGQAGKELRAGYKEGAKDEPVEGPCPFCGADVPAEAGFCPGCAKPADEIKAERARARNSKTA
ncbi:MAG TPA: twin-arginine translocase TatA/TatE family subunit [Actinomycetota bacterium]|jgi:sec-independent protein translocase protein TatA|nr:twin-arginine translocase TatA/TatE family subunit [Actinomycetota bacterium]